MDKTDSWRGERDACADTPPDYSKSLFLPRTDFPMRGGLPKKEPELLARWREIDLYRRLTRGRAGQAEIRPA